MICLLLSVEHPGLKCRFCKQMENREFPQNTNNKSAESGSSVPSPSWKEEILLWSALQSDNVLTVRGASEIFLNAVEKKPLKARKQFTCENLLFVLLNVFRFSLLTPPLSCFCLLPKKILEQKEKRKQEETTNLSLLIVVPSSCSAKDDNAEEEKQKGGIEWKGFIGRKQLP